MHFLTLSFEKEGTIVSEQIESTPSFHFREFLKWPGNQRCVHLLQAQRVDSRPIVVVVQLLCPLKIEVAPLFAYCSDKMNCLGRNYAKGR